MSDPHLDPQSGVLLNKFGLTDQASLDRAESDVVAMRSILLQGNAEAAIQTEKLCNRLMKIHNVDILCGYSLGSVQGAMDSDTFQRICAEHSALYSR